MSDRTVLIGTCGWQHPLWNETYYPEDLPEDWQLAYYGNEYPVVLIPASYWSQGRFAVESWLEETEGRPDFICEWTFKGGDEQESLIALLGDRVLGILVRLDTMPDDVQRDTLTWLAQSYPLCVDWPGVTIEQLQVLMSQLPVLKNMSICWHGDEAHSDDLKYGDLVLARVPAQGQSPRSLRSLLETLIKQARERQAVLLFDGAPPDLDVVDQAEVILNLIQ